MPSRAQARAPGPGDLERLIGSYRPLPGVPDELIGPDGRPRSPWLKLLGSLAELSPGEVRERFSVADRHVREMGVSYRTPAEGERPWSLGHLPVLVDEGEWAAIRAGVAQRAELLDRILADLYGPERLVADRLLPAAAVAGSPDYLRPLVGIAPPGGRHLGFYAADLGRGPDGRWWVLGDRTQAPSGAGYALQNRLVFNRVFSREFEGLNVRRLAPFFEAMREGLKRSAERDEPRIGLLTPGPYSETYGEHAFLARYLGFLLMEGDDLVVRDGMLHVRTVSGLKRVDVLWRRLDSDYVDPLELNAASRLGVPGLLEALRAGRLAMANMPGSGVVEGPALLGFLPALCRALLGEELRLPHVATWWCGQGAERAEVLAGLDRFAIRPAHGETLPGFPDRSMVLPSELDRRERGRLAERIESRGIDYVGQEVVRLSTTPSWERDGLVPRPFVLRVFAAATPDGWTVMPGGFCRLAGEPDARAVSMGRGAHSADVWISGAAPDAARSLLQPGGGVRIRRVAGTLPSRVADHLFWLGRYAERAEATLRVARALLTLRAERGAGAGSDRANRALRRLLVAWGAAPADPEDEVAGAAVAGSGYGAAPALAASLERAAGRLRDRLAPDAWAIVVELAHHFAPATRALRPDRVALLEATERGLRILAALSGLTHENMNRSAGWHFVDLGHRIERGIATCRFARAFADRDATADDLDVALDLADSQISYRSRYLAGLSLRPVQDLVILDPYNPRSVAFQVAAVERHLADLPSLRTDGLMDPSRRLAVQLRAELSALDAEALDASLILGIEQRLMRLADALAHQYFPSGQEAARPEKLTGLA